jgi:hypothetical protein
MCGPHLARSIRRIEHGCELAAVVTGGVGDDKASDETVRATIWTFREALKRTGAVEKLFQRFDTALKAADYLAMSGQIVDATIIAAPRQRNSEAEKEAIKAGAGQPQLPAAEVRFSFRSKG